MQMLWILEKVQIYAEVYIFLGILHFLQKVGIFAESMDFYKKCWSLQESVFLQEVGMFAESFAFQEGFVFCTK